MKRTSRMGVPSGFGDQSFWPTASQTCLGQLIRQTMKSQGRNEANDALGNPFGGLCQTVVNVEGRIRKLIKSSREPKHLAVAFHAAHGGGCYAGLAQFCHARNAARGQHGMGNLALGHG
ncbi:hypothetical protein HNR59_000654 [Aquamicrobium lusatiense]|uniref:Uncharacterized protein n=1 Tax=Aquamicrobium lusatiense TaxID=89772 RepID=A0A7W9S0V0_9HYPH|nr:hypothetical protein [Aquamicrobium lusatiense]